MKKLLFAIQVLGLIGLFPTVVILEINHIPLSFAENKPATGLSQETGRINIALPEKGKDRMGNTLLLTYGYILIN